MDTAHVKGNYPERCSIQATLVKDMPRTALVAQSMFWPVLLPEQPLSADAIARSLAGRPACGAM